MAQIMAERMVMAVTPGYEPCVIKPETAVGGIDEAFVGTHTQHVGEYHGVAAQVRDTFDATLYGKRRFGNCGRKDFLPFQRSQTGLFPFVMIAA